MTSELLARGDLNTSWNKVFDPTVNKVAEYVDDRKRSQMDEDAAAVGRLEMPKIYDGTQFNYDGAYKVKLPSVRPISL